MTVSEWSLVSVSHIHQKSASTKCLSASPELLFLLVIVLADDARPSVCVQTRAYISSVLSHFPPPPPPPLSGPLSIVQSTPCEQNSVLDAMGTCPALFHGWFHLSRVSSFFSGMRLLSHAHTSARPAASPDFSFVSQLSPRYQRKRLCFRLLLLIVLLECYRESGKWWRSPRRAESSQPS